MRGLIGLVFIGASSGCFVGEPLDSIPPPDGGAGVDGTAANDAPTPVPDAAVDATPLEAGTPLADAMVPRPDSNPSPSDASTNGVDAMPATCGGGFYPVTVTASGGAGSIFSNPPGISLSTGSSQSACFPSGQNVRLEETSELLCNWSGVTCACGNIADRRCEFIVTGPTTVSVVVP